MDAVVEGRTGLFFDDVTGMVDALDSVISDDILRKQLSVGALEFSNRFSWDNAARGALAVLAAEALRRRGPPPLTD
jgi:glycosyltransferase involved in cell wall biosynthesis